MQDVDCTPVLVEPITAQNKQRPGSTAALALLHFVCVVSSFLEFASVRQKAHASRKLASANLVSSPIFSYTRRVFERRVPEWHSSGAYFYAKGGRKGRINVLFRRKV